MYIVINGVIVVLITFKLKKLIAIVLILSAAIAITAVFASRDDVSLTSAEGAEYVLVIDPGHGGCDGGAIAANGTKESDINLEIALKTEAIADFAGIKSVLTRSTDTDGAENGNYSERQNLLNRVDVINNTPDAVLISVHQNVYPSDKVRGAEVMYAATNGSEELATMLQSNLVSYLDTENRRVARPAPEELLVTSSIRCTGVLAECGFLSCPDEAQRLASYDYQLKIAEIFIASFLQFTCGKTAY